MSITVNSVSYGSEKDIILDCSVKTIDLYKVVAPSYNDFLSSDERKSNGTMFKSALDFKLEFQTRIQEMVKSADLSETDVTITLYEVSDNLTVYFSPEAVDAVYGGVVKIKDEVTDIKTVTDVNGNEKKIESGNVNKGLINSFELRYESQKPDTSTAVIRFWNSLKEDFHKNFIKHDRWKTILKGLWVTIKLTLCALFIGIVIGFLVAFLRCTYLKNPKCGIITRILNRICGCYLTIIRGTPVVVQLMICYFVIFVASEDGVPVAIFAFGINSGAYVAEIFRAGIMSIDHGQFEAGRSLGFNYLQTMRHIIIPQMFKAVLPTLCNEFIALLKETSVAGYVGVIDLTKAGNVIAGRTFSYYMPLLSVAAIYLVMVMVLSWLVGRLERRLRKSER